MTTIQRTVDIPADHRLRLELSLPKDIPAGRAEIQRKTAHDDYHGRKEHPPVVLRGDPDMTRALIDSIDREGKFTARYFFGVTP